MVYLLPAALRMNALNVAIPRLTCSDAQRPGWLKVYFGDDGSCLLHPKPTALQPLSRLGRRALRCAVVERRSGATDLANYYPPRWGMARNGLRRCGIRLTKNQCGPGERQTRPPKGRLARAAEGSGPTPCLGSPLPLPVCTIGGYGYTVVRYVRVQRISALREYKRV